MKSCIHRGIALLIVLMICDTTQAQNWTWVDGSAEQYMGNYGTRGVETATNFPGQRIAPVCWTDATGNLWLFGGRAADGGKLNDLWRYNPSSGHWTWMKGSKLPDQTGTYGVIGVPAPENTPGGRNYPVSWTDASGRLWLFGGEGWGSTGFGMLNDLWCYDIASGNWTYQGGSTNPGQNASYGTMGVPSASNRPGARMKAVSWTDTSGDIWLFGGYGRTAFPYGRMNDLWRYSIATGTWTWMKGSSDPNVSGSYGSMGVEDASNTPGARDALVGWTDAGGNLWLFGGMGYTASALGALNDLWKYNPSTGNWTWIRGSDSPGQYGSYGTMGTEAPSNEPGSRELAAVWTDAAGNLWLFGGTGRAASASGRLNDLWRYNISTGNWTWTKGSTLPNQFGTYGVMGIPAVANTPGGRGWTAYARDGSGGLWLFGGSGYSATSSGYLNDLWKYDPASGDWSWMSGAKSMEYGSYGSISIPSWNNIPGARWEAVSWRGADGTFWLFGGEGYAELTSGLLGDLWKYDPSSGLWTWSHGSSTADQYGSYTVFGSESPANAPGSRRSAVTWVDAAGMLWMLRLWLRFHDDR